MHLIAIFILEILHVDAGHVSEQVQDCQFERQQFAVVVKKLIQPDPLTVLYPLLKLTQVGVLGILGGDDNGAEVFPLLVLAVLLSYEIKAQHSLQHLHDGQQILLRHF